MSKAFIRAQHLAPQHALSKLAGRFADSRNPLIRDPLIRRFAAAYGVDMAEADRPLGAYESFNDFFTRALKPGARPLADAAQFVLSPADGAVSQLGAVSGGRIVQAKGRDYAVAELLGGNAADAARFEGGRFATIYLSPKDYHRVHMPAAGTLRQTVYVPGDLFSVNGATAEGVDRLFARNERLSCMFDGELGRFASVMVGAMIVAGIATVWGGRVQPHGRKVIGENFADGARLAAGDEMGRFFLGSTVVLLFEPGRIEWLDGIGPGSVLRMGQALARRV